MFYNSYFHFYVTIIAAFATIGGIFFALYQWISINKNNKRAIVNAIFEEIKMNLYVRSDNFFPQLRPKHYRFLYNELEKLKDSDFYPNPTDSEEVKKYLFKGLDMDINDDSLIWEPPYATLRYNAIEKALTSGVHRRQLKSRIYINIGRLYYSLRRDEGLIERFNKSEPFNVEKGKLWKKTGVRLNYLIWTHFRLCFLLVDLVITYPEGFFSDKNEFHKIKNAIYS